MSIRQTRTYAILELSKSAVDEISEKLREAGYDHVFYDGVVDMHGIAVSYGPEESHDWAPTYPMAAVEECQRCHMQRLGVLWRRDKTDVSGWNTDKFPKCRE